jgi:hypothetical protein
LRRKDFFARPLPQFFHFPREKHIFTRRRESSLVFVVLCLFSICFFRTLFVVTMDAADMDVVGDIDAALARRYLAPDMGGLVAPNVVGVNVANNNNNNTNIINKKA